MNLLTDQWIPVRPLDGGGAEKITLQELLCGEKSWELCLPRDDMELAALQLLICITQVIMTPETPETLKHRIARPLDNKNFETTIRPFENWFRLDHSEYPFMQVRGVSASKITPMDKLMAGLTGATSCCFVNEPGLADKLCAGCTCITLFNQATCTPGFGGGFKEPLRGGTPITTLVQGKHLRQTIWLNVLSNSEIIHFMPWHNSSSKQLPTWLEPLQPGIIPAQKIGLARGLFWQPAHVELLPPIEGNYFCTCCGNPTSRVYTGFKTAKFSSYAVQDTWPHPHSPRTTELKKDASIESRFISFSLTAPAWTQLTRFVVQLPPQVKKEGYEPAAVLVQAKRLYKQKAHKLHLLVGGYVRKKASIVNRRHEVFTLNHGWDQYTKVITAIVALGIAYKAAVTGALAYFCKPQKDKKDKNNKLKGLGEKIGLTKVAEIQFYRRSEPTIENTLACIDFVNPEPELAKMRAELKLIAEMLFDESVHPYRNDPELIRTLATARIVLRKHLRNIEPQQDKGGDDATTEAS